jgi:hypothetical protein
MLECVSLCLHKLDMGIVYVGSCFDGGKYNMKQKWRGPVSCYVSNTLRASNHTCVSHGVMVAV